MKMKEKLVVAAAVAGLLAGGLQVAEAAPINHETVLTGNVVTVVPVGTAVHEGDTLVTVQTIAGPMVAARATVNGVVESVSAQPGAAVTRGAVVAVVNSK